MVLPPKSSRFETLLAARISTNSLVVEFGTSAGGSAWTVQGPPSVWVSDVQGHLGELG